MKYKPANAREYARTHLKGVWAAVPTPFTASLEFDDSGFRRNLAHWFGDLEIPGLFIGGKQGEFFSMSVAERKRLCSVAVEVAREFWRLMATNDFHSVGAVLAPDFILEWPQSGERIRGAENFARMNSEYPAHGKWEFTLHRIVGGESEAVSDVGVTDGTQVARAISFFAVVRGKVTRLVEFWPEPHAAPANRAHLVEPMD